MCGMFHKWQPCAFCFMIRKRLMVIYQNGKSTTLWICLAVSVILLFNSFFSSFIKKNKIFFFFVSFVFLFPLYSAYLLHYFLKSDLLFHYLSLLKQLFDCFQYSFCPSFCSFCSFHCVSFFSLLLLLRLLPFFLSVPICVCLQPWLEYMECK